MLEEITLWTKKIKEGMQLAHDFHFAHGARLPKNIKKIAFVGMGGSGIAGHIIKTFLDRKTNIPSFIIDSPTLPGFIDADTFVIAISYSGNTWETLACVDSLVERFIPTLVLTHGGKLAEIAESKNLPMILMPESSVPRSALGNFLGLLLTLFDLMGILAGKKILEEFLKQIELYVPKFEDAEYFKDFLYAAEDCDFFHIFGVQGDSGAFAYRAQTQFNENSKIQAVLSLFPELNHNLITAFEKFDKKPLVLLFSTEFMSPAMCASLEALTEVLKERGVTLYKPLILGDNWEGQLFHIILWSDFASCYLSKSRGVETNSTRLIDQLKKLYAAKRVK